MKTGEFNHNREFQRAEYQEASQMARQHASYRFTMFGFFVTLMTALVGATYWLLFKEDQLILGSLIGALGIVISFVAIAIDRRTMQLYCICEVHASEIERFWRETKAITELTPGSQFPDKGVFAQLSTSGDNRLLVSHSRALWTLYGASSVVFVVLLLYAFLKRFTG